MNGGERYKRFAINTAERCQNARILDTHAPRCLLER
jgi:hypothetical protein